MPRRFRCSADPNDLADAIEHTGARHVILAFSGAPDSVMLAHVRECEQLGVTVSLVQRLYESINQRATLGHVGGVPLVTLREVSPKGWQFVVKHVIDSAVAAIVLLAILPLMGVLALAVRFRLRPGRSCFRQRRIGRDGRPFDLLKFRTMRLPESGGEQQFELPDGVAPGGIEGINRLHPGRPLPASAVPRRTAAVHQRPARRHVHRRSAA